MIDIECNKKTILNKIQQAHKISNFSLLPVSKLVAVSKKQEDYKIDEAIKLGQKVFGENKLSVTLVSKSLYLSTAIFKDE